MKYCTKCGRELQPGEICNCSAGSGKNSENIKIKQQTNYNQNGQNARNNAQNYNSNSFREETGKYMKYAAGEVSTSLSEKWTTFRENLKDKSAFERGKQIVPDTIAPNDSEIPIRQYDNVAKLRSRMKLTWADGKLQLTNKRLIFRAPGRSLLQGKLSIQHEFAIDDISGIETRNDYRFSFLDALAGLIVFLFGGGILGWPAAIITGALVISNSSAILMLLLGLIVTLVIKGEKYYRKMLLMGGSMTYLSLMFTGSEMLDVDFLMVVTAIIVVLFAIVVLYLEVKLMFQHNLIIAIKTGAGNSVVEIRRKQNGVFAALGTNPALGEYTGFDEVLPGKDTERAIRELGAIINDIQKLGDYAIERWK